MTCALHTDDARASMAPPPQMLSRLAPTLLPWLLLLPQILFSTGGQGQGQGLDPAGPLLLPSDLLVDKRPASERPPVPLKGITRIHVIGERHTGTNNLETLLKSCLLPNTTNSTNVWRRFNSGECMGRSLEPSYVITPLHPPWPRIT